MKKIGFTSKCPNGDISALTNQIKMCREAGVDSLEISIFETDVICGKKNKSSRTKNFKRYSS